MHPPPMTPSPTQRHLSHFRYGQCDISWLGMNKGLLQVDRLAKVECSHGTSSSLLLGCTLCRTAAAAATAVRIIIDVTEASGAIQWRQCARRGGTMQAGHRLGCGSAQGVTRTESKETGDGYPRPDIVTQGGCTPLNLQLYWGRRMNGEVLLLDEGGS